MSLKAQAVASMLIFLMGSQVWAATVCSTDANVAELWAMAQQLNP